MGELASSSWAVSNSMCMLDYLSRVVVTSQESPFCPTGSGSQELSFLESGIHFGTGHRSHVNNEEESGGKPSVCVTGGVLGCDSFLRSVAALCDVSRRGLDPSPLQPSTLKREQIHSTCRHLYMHS